MWAGTVKGRAWPGNSLCRGQLEVAKASGRVWLEGRAGVRAGRGRWATLDGRGSGGCTEPQRVCRGRAEGVFTVLVDQGPQQLWGQRTEEPGPGQGGRRETRNRESAGGPTGCVFLLLSQNFPFLLTPRIEDDVFQAPLQLDMQVTAF